MAVPQLVIANAAFKKYPGGVFALRCIDWLGPARGTLTTEVDARASTGQAVRDTQQVTASIRTAAVTAFQEAEDTLVIDFADVPLLIDMTYAVFVSYLIEGNWDTANDDTFHLSNQAIFRPGCDLAWYGDTVFFPADTDPARLKNKVRQRPTYSLGTFNGTIHIGDVVGTEVLHWRAYGQDGTSIEWLLDQIVLVPFVTSGTKAGEWTASDFRRVSGFFGENAVFPPEDGDDGGDSNGKFTWHAFPEHEETSWVGDDGGGDFQHKSAYADAEYMIRIVPDDGFQITNSVTGEQGAAYAYSALGVRYREHHIFVDDQFERTVADGWGVGPQGYGWRSHLTLGSSMSVDGAVGIQVASLAGPGVGASLSGHATALSARVALANPRLTGEVTVSSFTEGTNPSRLAQVRIGFDPAASGGGGGHMWGIRINLLTTTWALTRGDGAAFTSDIAVPGFSFGSPIGFRIEIARYLIRAKVWDATGAEPGAWDFEVFRPLLDGGTWRDYPYAAASELLHEEAGILLTPKINTSTNLLASTLTTEWDNIFVEHEPYGDGADMSAAIERPEGTKVGEIVVPYGSDQIVYWGSRVWTDLDGFGDPMLDFSARVWNDPDAAELQRAEAPFWWFQSVHGGIVSMNWRRAQRKSTSHRVLTGG